MVAETGGHKIMISIHALREEGDAACCPATRHMFNFYPRPPRGGRQMLANKACWAIEFLSTPSARRATFRHGFGLCVHAISIHALREEGDPAFAGPFPPQTHFYPRPPRGGRPTCAVSSSWDIRFLSTPSARRATFRPRCGSVRHDISIHALREEGDLQRGTHEQVQGISIHALREEGDARGWRSVPWRS